MPMYLTVFYTLITAKNEKDLSRKAEATAEKFSEKIHKKVEVHGYAEVEQGSDEPCGGRYIDKVRGQADRIAHGYAVLRLPFCKHQDDGWQ